MLELSGEEYAAMLSQVINIPFVLGELVMVGFAYSFRDYRDMLRYSFAPCYVLLLIYFIVPESPRWLISANKYASYLRMIISYLQDPHSLYKMDKRFAKSTMNSDSVVF